MFINIGQNTVIPESSIIGIFDLDNSSWSKITRDYLAGAEKAGRVFSVCEDIPKSFVLCDENGKTTLYISQLSPATLLKRSQTGFGLG